jgi:hypothetical protein
MKSINLQNRLSTLSTNEFLIIVIKNVELSHIKGASCSSLVVCYPFTDCPSKFKSKEVLQTLE